MKRIGILGGMSWESTQLYYQLMNGAVREQLGGLHSAELILYSVDFDQIEKMQHRGDWAALGLLLASYAEKLVAAGADGLVIATNTMHKVVPTIQRHIDIPVLHIADCTGQVIEDRGLKRVGLLGTKFTMEDAFYKDRLSDQFGIEVLVPDASARHTVHDIIYQELCLGKINAASKAQFLNIIQQLSDNGAEAVILGCTEIGLLVQQTDTQIPLLDTTVIHAQQAVKWALS
jgi:aspartate racemase